MRLFEASRWSDKVSSKPIMACGWPAQGFCGWIGKLFAVIFAKNASRLHAGTRPFSRVVPIFPKLKWRRWQIVDLDDYVDRATKISLLRPFRYNGPDRQLLTPRRTAPDYRFISISKDAGLAPARRLRGAFTSGRFRLSLEWKCPARAYTLGVVHRQGSKPEIGLNGQRRPPTSLPDTSLREFALNQRSNGMGPIDVQLELLLYTRLRPQPSNRFEKKLAVP